MSNLHGLFVVQGKAAFVTLVWVRIINRACDPDRRSISERILFEKRKYSIRLVKKVTGGAE
jgi:hypothetical protein